MLLLGTLGPRSGLRQPRPPPRAKPLRIEAFPPLTPVLRCLYPGGNLSISNPVQHQILFVTEQLSREADGIVARCVPAPASKSTHGSAGCLTRGIVFTQ